MFVGIDVSKDRLDVHIRPSGESFSIARDDAGIAALAERLRAAAPALIVLEATGGFEVTVAAGLAGAGLPLAVVNPAQIRAFARAVGRLAKLVLGPANGRIRGTDRLDAAIIARFADQVRPAPRPVADAQAQALAELVARRRQLVEMIAMESNRRRRRAAKGCSRASAAPSPRCAPSSTTRSRARPPGAPPRTCSPRCPASARSPPEPSSPSCPSSAASTAAASPPWSASPPSTATAAPCAATARSPAAEPRSATSSSWPRSPPHGGSKRSSRVSPGVRVRRTGALTRFAWSPPSTGHWLVAHGLGDPDAFESMAAGVRDTLPPGAAEPA